MKRFIFALVFISPPFVKKLILKWFCGARFGRKSSVGWFSSVIGSHIEIGDYSSIKPFTLVRCDGKVEIGKYSEVSSFSLIYGCGNFEVGQKCYIGPQSLINVSEDVVIGNRVGIGARTMIYTHGSFLPYTEGYWVRFGRVTIGNSVWVSTGVFIHPGIEIGDNVFVGSRSVVNKSIPAGQVVEGFPAKPVSQMEKIRRPITPTKRDALILNMLKHFVSFLQRTSGGIKVSLHDDKMTLLRTGRHDYLILLVNADGIPSINCEEHREKIIVAMVNYPDWKPSISKTKMLIFDFTTMKTRYSKDVVHRELYEFMRMYYGVIFEND
jgi:acetyltransferase-like isoleucine patch superfamily enzyme